MTKAARLKAQIRSHVYQSQTGVDLCSALPQDARKRRQNAKRSWLAIQARGPLARKFVFRGREKEISDYEPEAGLRLRNIGSRHIAGPLQKRAEGAIHSQALTAFRPKRLELLVVEEHAGKVGLRVEVCG